MITTSRRSAKTTAKPRDRGSAPPKPRISAQAKNGHDNATADEEEAEEGDETAELEDSQAEEEASSIEPQANGNGATATSSSAVRRRRTAHEMAAAQRDISVSEFFAKNRHLLGFDNPRKALLTTVKEAVDNSLDACEEAGILPEIWVKIVTAGSNRFRVSIQDNGPGIIRKQIPLIFGKLLYGSKFHRLRQSRGQQGIGISAAGMYGVQTTGKPVKIISKVSKGKPAHYFEIQIDTKKNRPEILNGRGEGEDVPLGPKGLAYFEKRELEWVEVSHGTQVSIELEARYQRGRGSVDEYLYQTAIANPHITLHYTDPEGNSHEFPRSAEQLPKEPKEIKPHPHGVELGRLATMLKETSESTVAGFLTKSFSRVSPGIARNICKAAGVNTRASTTRIGRREADSLYTAIQATKIPNPSTDCICPIGEDLILKGLRQVVPGEFYAAATRAPAVYRGNPFQIEVGLVYGGCAATTAITQDLLEEFLEATDARTIRQFLVNTFGSIGVDAADRIAKAAGLGNRQSPAKLKPREITALLDALQNVNPSDGQTMEVFRLANRVPLQFQTAACAITQTVMQTNWRSYGLTQSRGALPKGPVTLMVHLASVWVPFTSESKEAVASYPEIQKELRLALQAVGRKLGMFLRKRLRMKQQSDRRSIFLRYLGEVAGAVSVLNQTDRKTLYDRLLRVANRSTSEADMVLDERGRRVDPVAAEEAEFGGSVLIVPPEELLPARLKQAAKNPVEKPPIDEPSTGASDDNGTAGARRRASRHK